jgi:predicted transcriptional regulator
VTQLKVIAIAAEMVKAGKTNEEIRNALFDTKGVRVQQICNVMKLLETA